MGTVARITDWCRYNCPSSRYPEECPCPCYARRNRLIPWIYITNEMRTDDKLPEIIDHKNSMFHTHYAWAYYKHKALEEL